MRSDLKLHEISRLNRTTFDVPGGICAISGIESSSLPTAIGVIDAAIDTAAVEALRIGDAHDHPFFGFWQEGQE